MFDINKKIQIGNLKLDFPFFLAPMAGVTDYAFRVIAKEFGAGVVYSEFVSAHGIIRKNEKTLNMIKFSEFERPIGIQIFGDTPEVMENAAKLVYEKFKPDLIDINYGCPVPKVTKKGAGYDLAEEDRIKYHAISKTNTSKNTGKTKPKYQDIFSNWVVDMAREDSDLVAITPAMREGSGLVEFSKEFPERYFDVAIAEQHAVTLSAGLACEKKKPVVAIYSTFLQRAYDQLIHDVALQNLDVTFAIDRAGLVGEDGPTHSGNYDLVYLRCIPNMIVMTPSDENETRKLLTTGFFHNGPASIRYPRGSGPNVVVENDLSPVEIGKGRLIKEGSKNLIVINFGALLDQAEEVADTLGLTLIDMRFVKPLDEDILRKYLSEAQAFVSIEDGSVAGGAGSAVQEFCSKNNINVKCKLFGIPDVFIEHQSREEMIEESGLKASRIIKEIEGLELEE